MKLITKKIKALVVIILFCITLKSKASEALKDYPIKPVPFTKVLISDTFWRPRIETNISITIPHILQMCEKSGRIDKFIRAAQAQKNDPNLKNRNILSYPFDDADVYKAIEAASYSLYIKPDQKLDKQLDILIERIGKAQEADGYLYTARTINPQMPHSWAGKNRWEKEEELSHELYNAGHLYEAAIAHYTITGKKTLLNIAIKNADLVCKTFGPGKIELAPGHQEIEIGLIKLYRATGKIEYLNLAKFFVDIRGTGKIRQEYNQTHLKIVDQNEAVGHVVRAMFMYAGVTDVAIFTNSKEYKDAIERLWQNVVDKKMYIMGGVGIIGGSESFGENYELPNLGAFCETCATVGNIFWNHRLFLMNGEAKYIDVMERCLYNGLLASVSLNGKTFFYANPLTSMGYASRNEWLACACCTGNIARVLGSISEYIYAYTDNSIYVNLYIGSEADIELKDCAVKISQTTLYPQDGHIKLAIDRIIENKNKQATKEFTIFMRIPGWAQDEPVPGDLYKYMNQSNRKPVIKVNGQIGKLQTENGYFIITRNWKNGDEIELDLPMTIHRVKANANVEDDKGRIAIERGPILFCAEGVDNENEPHLILKDDSPLSSEFNPNVLGGIQIIKGKALVAKRSTDGKSLMTSEQNFFAIPYSVWLNRTPSPMNVWFASNEDSVIPAPGPTIAYKSKLTASAGSGVLSCITDQAIPKNSNDTSMGFYHWWPRAGTSEWIQLDFDKTYSVSSSKIYWFDDTPNGSCRIPKSWKLLYHKDNNWIEVKKLNEYLNLKDQFNQIKFEPVETNGLRIELQLQEKWSGGILEWQVE